MIAFETGSGIEAKPGMMDSTRRLDYRELNSYKPLFLDYVYRFDRLAPYFSGNPGDPDVWGRVAQKVSDYPRQTKQVSEVLHRQNREMGADPAVSTALDSLANGALAVVTGQQVGLFGGPLYSLYKALTAVELARQVRSIVERPVVALFWMDADDHDFEEVNSVNLIDPSVELIALSYQPGELQKGAPVGALPLDSSIEDLITRAGECLAPSEFKQEIFDALRESYAPGKTLAEAFGSWLLRMTRGTGLAIVDPTARPLKSLAASLFQRETSEKSESTRLVEETTGRLVSQGYHAQASTADQRLNLLYSDPVRSPIVVEDSGFRLSDQGSTVSPEELSKLVDESPERFSANVLLRPLVQDHLLPTISYVGGPNELAYLAQLGAVYDHFGVPMPIIVPRTSTTIVEKAAAKFMSRHKLELSDLRANDESVLNDILKDLAPPQLDEDLSRARTCIQEITQTLEKDLAAVDPTLAATAKSTRGKLLHHLGELEAKSRRAIKKKNDTLRRQFLSARTTLFPNFDMQERQLSPVQYLAKYGWHFTDMVRESIDVEEPGHVLLFP